MSLPRRMPAVVNGVQMLQWRYITLILTTSRATSIADSFDLGFALIHKERARPNEVSRMVLVGDVKDRIAIIVDDMADTCGTLVKAADVVIDHGAKEAIAIVTHGILSGDAIEKLNGSKLKKLVITNTVPLSDEKRRRLGDRIEIIDISPTVSLRRPRSAVVRSMLILAHFSWRKRAGERTMERVCPFCSSMCREASFLISAESLQLLVIARLGGGHSSTMLF